MDGGCQFSLAGDEGQDPRAKSQDARVLVGVFTSTLGCWSYPNSDLTSNKGAQAKEEHWLRFTCSFDQYLNL